MNTPVMGDHEKRIEALETLLPAAALNLIHKDPHQWSDRGCPTCRAITTLIGQPFGCYWFQNRQKK